VLDLDFGRISDDLLSRGYEERWRVADADTGGIPGRRTVTIRGQGSERSSVRRDGRDRRPVQRRHERAGFRPDRAALWAVMLCVMLVLVAVTSAHA